MTTADNGRDVQGRPRRTRRPPPHADLHEWLLSECRSAVPVSRLSAGLRRKLDSLPLADRRDVVNRLSEAEGCSPLFLACRGGSAGSAEYLLYNCDADVERRGLFEVLEEGVSHHVTPLWCAAVSGRLAVVKSLIRFGADVNAASDSGSTPLRSACYIVRAGLDTSHLEIIKYVLNMKWPRK